MIDKVPTEQLVGTLYNFRCTRDADIQDFLQNKALQYENRGWCSTYILANEEKLEKDRKLWIEGYFTLSNKVIELSDLVSKTQRKRLFKGLKKKDNFIHFVLVGQLGKYIDERSDENVYGETNAVEMLDKAFEIIYQVKERITCSCVLVECKDDTKVREIYETYGFKELQKENELIQYVKFI